MNSLMTGALKLDMAGISENPTSSDRQKQHKMSFRTQVPYRSSGSKSSHK
jgi:hypothetical protein